MLLMFEYSTEFLVILDLHTYLYRRGETHMNASSERTYKHNIITHDRRCMARHSKDIPGPPVPALRPHHASTRPAPYPPMSGTPA